ncbi:MAG: PAS domain-containing protein [Bacteroidota bacterium]
MTNFFSIPDKEKNYQSYMVYVLCILWTVVIIGIVSIGFIYFPQIWWRWVILIGISLFIAICTLTLNYFRYTRLASWTLTIMLWLQVTIPCYSAGGIMAPGILQQMSVILTAGFLLGWRGGLAIGLLSIMADFYFAYLEMKGYLPIPTVQHNPMSRWIVAIIPFGTILALQYYATKHLNSSLIALRHEITKREEAEKTIQQTVNHLEERVKELKTLYAVSRVLQNEDSTIKNLVCQLAEILPAGWQYPHLAGARVCIADSEYKTSNYQSSIYSQHAEIKTSHGTMVSIEVVYSPQVAELDEHPFLQEEQNLIGMLAEMVKMNIEWREHTAELKDYKYALDVASIVSISNEEGQLIFVNDNFCKLSKYNADELIGQPFSLISSGFHSQEYFMELGIAMQDGKPFRGEFCNKAKDGSLYWVDTSIVPFLNENGKVYQYLSINHDITKRKEADDKIKESEQLLKKITSQIPGNTYMFEIEEDGHMLMHFVNKGTDTFNHSYGFDELSKNPELLREILHPDDKLKFNDTMKEAYQTKSIISFQYRIIVDEVIRWRWMQAVPEKSKNGKIIWYGATNDITPLVDYLTSIEQIIFDIGHVIRRPVASILAMSKLITENEINEADIKVVSEKFHSIAEEMDKFIGELNQAYDQKRKETKLSIDIYPIIDKRSSLFS